MSYNHAALKACQKLFENQELCRLINELMFDSSGVSLSSLPVQEVPRVAVAWLRKVTASELAWDAKRGRGPTAHTKQTLEVLKEIQAIMDGAAAVTPVTPKPIAPK
jgi:hypothetical protein